MMPTEIKILATALILLPITLLFSTLDTFFCRWGEKMFGTFDKFTVAIFVVYLVPIFITLLYTIWTN